MLLDVHQNNIHPRFVYPNFPFSIVVFPGKSNYSLASPFVNCRSFKSLDRYIVVEKRSESREKRGFDFTSWSDKNRNGK